MAQQASPNVMGQRLDLRPQFTTLSTVVKTRLSPNRFWMRPPVSVMRSVPVFGAYPRKVALPPHVCEGRRQDGDEHDALHEGQHPQLAEGHGPGQQEHGLHVEDDEDEGEHVEADVELDPCRPHRILTALVGGELLLTV